MFFNQSTFKRVMVLISVFCIPAFALRLLTYWTELDPVTGFFKENGTICLIYNVLSFLVLAFCLLLSLSKGKKEENKENPEEKESPLFLEREEDDEMPRLRHDTTRPMLPEFAVKSVIWQGTLSAFFTFLPGFGFLAYSLSFFTSQSTDWYVLLFALLSALSGLYFIAEGVTNLPHPVKFRPFAALLPALWCVLRMVIEYRDLARFVNKTLYVGQFLFIISALFFFLYRAQLLLGEKAMHRPNSFAYSALTVLFFGLTCRLPQLIAMFGDKAPVDLIDASSLVIDLAITCFALSKVRILSED